MAKAYRKEGEIIGEYDGNKITTEKGRIIYVLIEGEVFTPTHSNEEDTSIPSKGLLMCIGKTENNVGTSFNGETLFFINH